MAATIEVEQIGGGECQVRVIGGESETSHRVTTKTDDYEQIAGEKVEPAELVRRAIAMLLARERRKPIPEQCDLTIIAQFFAEFKRAKKNASSAGCTSAF
jgi:hypothetical protein